MNTRFYISIINIFLVFSVFAQDKSINGIVIDSETQEVLPFTNIGVVGKNQGTVSNSEGYFTLSVEEIAEHDSIYISYVGYIQQKLSVADLKKNSTIILKKNAIVLSDFVVSSRQYTPEEILDSLKANYDKNHTQDLVHQEVFSRDASTATIHKSNLDYKKSTFEAIDGRFVYEFNQSMPEQLNVYGEYMADLYTNKKYWKLVPTVGQALVENWNFDDEFNKRMAMLTDDLEDNVRSEDNYFKIRSGVFAGKLDFGSDSTFVMTEDSTHLIGSTKILRADLAYLIRTYGSLGSKRWDFFSDYRLYNYKLEDVSIINNELAYIIKFSPRKRKGKYEGTICVSVNNFALLQVDYGFAEGKEGIGMSLLGVKYAVLNRSGRAIYEKGKDGYNLKYLSRESKERFGVDRTLSVMQKQKKSGVDKTLQEVKVRLDLDVTYDQKKELLVVSHRNISRAEFDSKSEPSTSKAIKVETYNPDIWKNSSIIEPTKAMKEYQQQYE